MNSPFKFTALSVDSLEDRVCPAALKLGYIPPYPPPPPPPPGSTVVIVPQPPPPGEFLL